MLNRISLLFITIIALLVMKSVDIIKNTIAKKESDIAILTLYSDDGKTECKNFINAYGHTFFSFTNNSDADITIYHYPVSKGETIYFSWWAVDKHLGIWFNIESNYIEKYNRYNTRYSIRTYLDDEEVKTLNSFLNTNDIYDPINNCSKMCLKCWNVVSEDVEKIDIKFLTTPKYMVKEIKKFSDAKYRECIQKAKTIGYMNNGKFVSYEME